MSISTSRIRPTWPDLPDAVRAAIEERLGTPVTGSSSRDGGYSPGLASVLSTAHGPVFVKAVATHHEFAARLHRQEVDRAGLLPEGVPAPHARWTLDITSDDSSGDWVAVAFDAVEGVTPAVPLRGAELDAVADLALRIAGVDLAPAVLPELADERPAGTAELADELPAGLAGYDPWFADHLDLLATLEGSAREAARGSSLVHGDLRGDNAVLTRADVGLRAVAVDWPYACRGAAFCDLVGMLPAVEAQGGPPPEAVLARHPLPPGTDDDAVTAYLTAMTGYFVASSLRPDPPGIPHVRPFQRIQAETGIAWLRRRLGS